MSGLIEYLSIVEAAEPTFTINSGVTEVATVAGSAPMMANGVGDTYFRRGDGVTIVEFGAVLPYQFGPGASLWEMALSWVDSTGLITSDIINTKLINLCGGNNLAGGNFAGIYSPFPQAFVGKARLRMTISGTVSMVNLPAVLSGALNVHGWVKAQHNFALEAAPV